jgi:hypothetical protein
MGIIKTLLSTALISSFVLDWHDSVSYWENSHYLFLYIIRFIADMIYN